ncbi:hypothetical protein JOF53_008260 [Crossiella equi]|uniref:Uncharacterized protein n=1 Tax=Crossiella equi TaxID=130796 RepID=A0ABS5AS54_9PSEU|nr:carboxypeptidase-like regulatory domain-containing protein [Crossiella equi]MBP2479388.1 hypothetical protein [Crossiella equi]
MFRTRLRHAVTTGLAAGAVLLGAGVLPAAAATPAEAPVVNLDFTSAVTGGPVPTACVHFAPDGPNAHPNRFGIPSANLHCAHGTGKLSVDFLEPGRYRIFAVPGNLAGGDGVHGAQWVGPGGGTGDPELARVFEVPAGATTTVPVRFDGGGTITGRVTDADTGAAVSEICPTVTPSYSGHNQPWAVRCTWTEGTYTINALGPYDWRVQFPDIKGRYAWQWSGEAADRYAATPLRVTAGAATTLDVRLRPAGRVTGRIHGATLPWRYVSVNAYNTRTGDPAGPDGWVKADGTYELAGLATQDIRIGFYATPRDSSDWYPRPVHVTQGRTLSGVDLHASPQG